MHLVESHKSLDKLYLSNRSKQFIQKCCECGDADNVLHTFKPEEAYQEILNFAKNQQNSFNSSEQAHEFAYLCFKQNLITQEEHSKLDLELEKILKDSKS